MQTTLPDNTRHSQETDIPVPCRIRTHNPSKLVAADLRLRTHDHQDRLVPLLTEVRISYSNTDLVHYSLKNGSPNSQKQQHVLVLVFIKQISYIIASRKSKYTCKCIWDVERFQILLGKCLQNLKHCPVVCTDAATYHPHYTFDTPAKSNIKNDSNDVSFRHTGHILSWNT